MESRPSIGTEWVDLLLSADFNQAIVTTIPDPDQARSVSRTKLVLRFVVAFIAFTALILPFLPLLPPNAYLQLVAIGTAGLISIPISVVFVRRSYSLKRLGKFPLAMNVLVVLTALAAGGLRIIVRPLVGPRWPVGTIFSVTAVVLAYVLAFHFVYRGGYGRLKARVT